MQRFTKPRLLITAFGLLCLIGYMFVWPECYLRLAPIETNIRKPTPDYVGSHRFTYCKGIYGITEFGDIRLAVRGCWFTGSSSSSEIVLTNVKNGAWTGGSTGVGKRRFTTSQVDGGTACTFAGLSFEIVDGMLRINDSTIPAYDGDRLVIINMSGEVESISKI